MRVTLLSVAVVLAALLTGCSERVCRVRATAEIVDAPERIVSLELVGAPAFGGSHVVCHGVYTPRYLNQSEDSLSDFTLGHVWPHRWRAGNVTLFVTEAGQTRLVPLTRPAQALCSSVLYLHLTVPRSLDEVQAEWLDDDAGVAPESGGR
jgi:hypothetical protein